MKNNINFNMAIKRKCLNYLTTGLPLIFEKKITNLLFNATNTYNNIE